jgi:hypothetical protein
MLNKKSETSLAFFVWRREDKLNCQKSLKSYLNFFPADFLRSIRCLIWSRFLVLCERLDLFFGLSVVPRFAIYIILCYL